MSSTDNAINTLIDRTLAIIDNGLDRSVGDMKLIDALELVGILMEPMLSVLQSALAEVFKVEFLNHPTDDWTQAEVTDLDNMSHHAAMNLITSQVDARERGYRSLQQ